MGLVMGQGPPSSQPTQRQGSVQPFFDSAPQLREQQRPVHFKGSLPRWRNMGPPRSYSIA